MKNSPHMTRHFSMDEITLTYDKLTAILDDFQEWYESQWMADVEIVGDDASGAECYVRIMRKDPLWPERLPEPQ